MATRQAFITALLPAAIEVGNRIGVDPRIIVAQAAQETGWGRSAPGNNYFGIKSHGKGGGQTFTTHEVIDGKRVKIQDSFRQFESPAESVHGYGEFLSSNKRYRPMLQAQGLDAQLAALGRSGYATDPNYAASVGAIAREIPLDGVAPETLLSPGKIGGDSMVARSADEEVAGALSLPNQDKQPFNGGGDGGAWNGGILAGIQAPIQQAAGGILGDEAMSYLTSEDRKGKSGFSKGMAMLADTPNAPMQRLGGGGDARESGDALLKVLMGPTYADMMMKRRFG